MCCGRKNLLYHLQYTNQIHVKVKNNQNGDTMSALSIYNYTNSNIIIRDNQYKCLIFHNSNNCKYRLAVTLSQFFSKTMDYDKMFYVRGNENLLQGTKVVCRAPLYNIAVKIIKSVRKPLTKLSYIRLISIQVLILQLTD